MNESNISLASIGSNSSSVNTYCKSYWGPDSDAKKIAKRTVHVLLSVIGISLNIFIIILADKFKVRKNLHHLIINMAVSDTLFLLMLSLYRVPWLSDYQWSIFPSGTLGLVICKTITFLEYSSFVVSLITLLVISVERFRATALTMQRRRHYTLKQRVLILGVCWLIPMPAAGYFAYIGTNTNTGHACSVPYWLSDVRFIYILLIILCCVIVVLSILTIRRLSKPQAIQANLSEQQQKNRKCRTLAAIRMVLASVFLYASCWIPNYVLSTLSTWIINSDIPSACIDWDSLFFIINAFLPLFNSCFSPCIYIIFLPDFRQAAKKFLFRRNTVNKTPNRRNSIELQPMENPVVNNRS